jgi:hypothetical protein
MDKGAVGLEDFFRVRRLSPDGIIPPTLHTHLYLHVALTRTKPGEAW